MALTEGKHRKKPEIIAYIFLQCSPSVSAKYKDSGKVKFTALEL